MPSMYSMKGMLTLLAEVPGVLGEFSPATTAAREGDRTADTIPEYVHRANAIEKSPFGLTMISSRKTRTMEAVERIRSLSPAQCSNSTPMSLRTR